MALLKRSVGFLMVILGVFNVFLTTLNARSEPLQVQAITVRQVKSSLWEARRRLGGLAA